jgi:hypothetical protein
MLVTMKNRLWVLSITLLVGSALISLSFKSNDNESSNHLIEMGEGSETEWTDCVTKGSSEWGGSCLNYGFSEDKYTVHLVNTCSDDVDLMSCVQRTNNQWSCFYRMDMHKSDTLHAYACQGNGKYLKWVRKAGDIKTKFPTRKEVNDQY